MQFENFTSSLLFDSTMRCPSGFCIDPELSTIHMRKGKTSLLVDNDFASPVVKGVLIISETFRKVSMMHKI